jgi:hypothetical protein
MITVPLSGSIKSVTFAKDDTIETVRQMVALAAESHPDRLFIEVNAILPKDYYATNPLHWSTLFYRLSIDGQQITADRLSMYATQIRSGVGIVGFDITKSEWDNPVESLKPLREPESDFKEWRILGVEDSKSFCLPIPPVDIAGLQAGSRPVPKVQSLFDTFHSYSITEFRATIVPDKPSPSVLLDYYPRLRPDDTPSTIEMLRPELEGSQKQFIDLLNLDVPKHQTISIMRAKWYIPLISTEITSPRIQFEQMFYGLTLSPKTPHIAFYTSSTETTRHKFYCPDVKKKTPLLNVILWKSWWTATLPQRQTPTIIMYRGTSRLSFDRISINKRNITIESRRGKGSKDTLEMLRDDMIKWINSLDAVVPFLIPSDIDVSRWELDDLSVLSTYAKEIDDFNLLRFSCLQNIFAFQDGVFRLLRSEHPPDGITPREFQAMQILNDPNGEETADYLASEMQISKPNAEVLLKQVMEREKDVNLTKSLKAYPIIKFSPKDVTINFVTNLERTLQYANILRHVLTSDADDVDAVCPKRAEKFDPVTSAAAVVVDDGINLDDDDEFADAIGDFDAPIEQPAAASSVVQPPKRKVTTIAVDTKQASDFNYFNDRLQKYNPSTFDKSFYAKSCEKSKQVIVLTPEDMLKSEYNYSDPDPKKRLSLKDPEGIAICPPYWCMRDEIALLEEQLEKGDDGLLHCPECKGKIITNKGEENAREFTVIKRDSSLKYPDYLKELSTINSKRIPCCYKTARNISKDNEEAVKKDTTLDDDITYVLQATNKSLKPLRIGAITPKFANQLGLTLNYEKTIGKGRLLADKGDIFRVGIGRPSKTLPVIFNDSTPILTPKNARDNVMKCSFFRTWKQRGDGDTEADQIISSIDSAYELGELGLLDELEYVTTFLLCEIIRVDSKGEKVICGFWGSSKGAVSRTIALIDDLTVLVKASRLSTRESTIYQADLRKMPFSERTIDILRELHGRACSIDLPLLNDAINEVRLSGAKEYRVILDPFERIQAILIPKVIILPVYPTNIKAKESEIVLSGYDAISNDDIPTADTARGFLSKTKHPMFKIQTEIANIDGEIIEFELASGFRTPIQPVPGSNEPVREVLGTIRMLKESTLVSKEEFPEDIKLAEEILYSSEIYEFLLFSISKDVAVDSSGDVLKAEYKALRDNIEEKSPDLLNSLKKWFDEEGYEDSTKTPFEFVNKIRTPCGQFTTKDTCNNSSLCGWHKDTCKIRVKSSVDIPKILRRIVKTLVTNDKQRALVLDGRISSFFSTVLYLEMPHELITTSV